MERLIRQRASIMTNLCDANRQFKQGKDKSDYAIRQLDKYYEITEQLNSMGKDYKEPTSPFYSYEYWKQELPEPPVQAVEDTQDRYKIIVKCSESSQGKIVKFFMNAEESKTIDGGVEAIFKCPAETFNYIKDMVMIALDIWESPDIEIVCKRL